MESPLAHQPTSQPAGTTAEQRERAEAAIEQLVRPMISADGGDIRIAAWKDDGVVIHLGGSCSGCPGRPYTISRMIEPLLRQQLGDSITIVVENG